MYAQKDHKPDDQHSHVSTILDIPVPSLRGGEGSRHVAAMNCRGGCAACCIAPSISSAIPGMPGGKPAGVPCVQLDELLNCRLFGMPERPAVCQSLKPTLSMCGASADEALHRLFALEQQTQPPATSGQRRAVSPT